MRHPVLALLLAALSAAAPWMAEAAPARRATSPASDVTPPQLTYFNLPKAITVSQPYGTTLVHDIRAQDDSAGVWYVWPTLIGPSGQSMELNNLMAWGDLSVDQQVGSYLSVQTEPGQWMLGSVRVCDAATNCAVLDGAALTAVGGRHRVSIKNPGYDAVAPSLTAGEVTRYYRQGMVPAYLIARIGAQDSGTLAVSGVATAQIELCLSDNTACVSASGGTNVPGLSTATLVLGNQMPEFPPQGQYWIKTLRIGDQSGNQRVYTSTLFGGSTDFGQVFPQPWINLP